MTLVIKLKKIESNDTTKYTTFYSNSKAETITNESDIADVFESIYTTIISNIPNYLGKDSGWIIDSVIIHPIDIPNYNPLAGSTYINLPKKLDHPRRHLFNIQNINDNECLKWYLVRYLHRTNHNPKRIRKVGKL